VDWLTEVIRRLSEAAMDGAMPSVKITPMRLEKVRSYFVSPYCMDGQPVYSGRNPRLFTRIKNGVDRKSLLLKMLFNNTVRNSVL